MYAQAAIKSNTLLRNGAYGIVMRGVQKCTRGCSSLRGRNRLPLCCIKLDTATDYACGAGHFLTEGFEAVEVCANAINNSENSSNQWVEKKIFGIEKDYRLARVSKISMFMHGAGDGNIIFGDGLENYPDKEIIPKSFDILVANPPYSVKAFKVYFDARTKIHLYEYIASRHDETKALFVSLNNPHNRLSIRGIETILHKVGSNLKSTKVHPHKFRRTLATKAIDKGMPIEQVQVLLGHSQIDTTLRYAMVNQNNVKASHHKYIG